VSPLDFGFQLPGTTKVPVRFAAKHKLKSIINSFVVREKHYFFAEKVQQKGLRNIHRSVWFFFLRGMSLNSSQTAQHGMASAKIQR
jgi:hypothetical protein